MNHFVPGIPYMDQAPAMKPLLDRLALKAGELVAENIIIDGNPSFPTALRGSVVTENGTYIGFESITPEHAVMYLRPGLSAKRFETKKIAESGTGFYYALPQLELTATEARGLINNL